MAVAFDATSVPLIAFPLNQQTVSHTLGTASGTDRILFVFFEILGGSGPHEFDNMTYDGVAMTELVYEEGVVFGSKGSMTVFYLLDADLPAAAGAYDYSYKTSTGAMYTATSSSVSYTGASQVVPPFVGDSVSTGGGGSAADVDTAITPVSSAGLLVDFVALAPNAGPVVGTAGASQTDRGQESDGDEGLFYSDKVFTSTAANNMLWGLDTPVYNSSHVIVELAEAGGGGGSDPNAIMFGANF